MKKDKPPTNQIDIDFKQAAEDALQVECAEVANKYKVADKTKIFKDPEGVWRFYGTYRPVEEWAKTMDTLYEDNDNTSLYKR